LFLTESGARGAIQETLHHYLNAAKTIFVISFEKHFVSFA